LQDNGPAKQPGVAIFILVKVDFKYKLVRREKEHHFLLTKGTTHQEEIKNVYLYVSGVNAANFIKQIPLDLETQYTKHSSGGRI
jgi:hypothetical protein